MATGSDIMMMVPTIWIVSAKCSEVMVVSIDESNTPVGFGGWMPLARLLRPKWPCNAILLVSSKGSTPLSEVEGH